ncbi:MAG: hypothetical protein ACUVQY_04875 [Thermoproteota archaeon]
MSFETQELPDIIRLIVLLSLSKRGRVKRPLLKRRIDMICQGYTSIDTSDLDDALIEMASEDLIHIEGDAVQLTNQGLRLGREWRSLFLKKEPIIEVVAGISDGSTTGLVVILSTFIASLTVGMTLFTALLALMAVALTNFSSFLLGGVTEDLADMSSFQTLINYSLSDIPDESEREQSFKLVERLFIFIRGEIRRANVYSALACGVTTFLSGGLPATVYLLLPKPTGAVLSIILIGIFFKRVSSEIPF